MKVIREDYDDFNSKDEKPITTTQKLFADELFNIFQDLVDDSELKEKFISTNTYLNHFYKHCIGKSNKKSIRSNVLYDFSDPSQYKTYEEKISVDVNKTKYTVVSLLDSVLIIKYMRKLFEGNASLLFTTSCGFKNNINSIMIGLHAYANQVTKNYKQNTIDFIVISPTGKTLSLLALDANYLENKLNNVIQKYSSKDKPKLKFNK